MDKDEWFVALVLLVIVPLCLTLCVLGSLFAVHIAEGWKQDRTVDRNCSDTYYGTQHVRVCSGG